MSKDNKCFFCGSQCEKDSIPSKIGTTRCNCKYCGKYLFDIGGYSELRTPENEFKMACILNERRLKGLDEVALDDKTDKDDKVMGYPRISVSDLLDEFPSKASDFLNRALLNLSRMLVMPFDVIRISPGLPAERLSLFASDMHTFATIIKEFNEQGLIKEVSVTSSGYKINLTAKCWELIENLQQTAIDSDRVFVAMWFDKSMDKYYTDGIKPAIEEAGYKPVRIDGQDFNGKICDEIIAEINRSKFVIADFCEQRGGVYFEAGYAMGQGKPVIFTASEAELKKVHFDTRQYNHIEYDSPEDLKKKLYNRICATIV